MMKNVSRLLALTSVAAMALPAVAVADNYLRLSYSMADYDEQDLEFTLAPDPAALFTIDGYDPDKSDYYGLAVGTWLTDHLRAELALDLSQASKEKDSVTFGNFGGVIPADFDAKTSSHLLMVNAFYHFVANRSKGSFDPYVGLGLGAADNEIKGMTISVGPDFATLDDGENTEFAFRAGAGIGFWITDEASVDLSVFYVDAGMVEGGDFAIDGGNQFIPIAETVEVELQSINYSLGVNFSF
ncbi:porin family protein [Alcanivorax sp. S6407]|uniref:outer membrane beta-barrel protein n=1 Tax=Alcanivorax sp. S6407 TaxID=2926424 RepID=UPI001FF48243|nr:outer membrane beta-barrel protein [Alcanivorax sp. S6407]MCK0152688.1 porin family protein [Alcanivorax sp. S6407]